MILFQREVNKLKHQILALGAAVEENLRLAVQSVLQRDPVLAQRVIAADAPIDLTEVDVEEECLKILALHQPVAHYLRYLIAILKINHDLERIGDMAVNIAERTVAMNGSLPIELPIDLEGMSHRVQHMLASSLDAMVEFDAELATRVWLSDDEVDDQHRLNYERLAERLRQHPEEVNRLFSLLTVSRNLERIADHAASIAKDIIYMVEGRIVRHQSRVFKARAGGEEAAPAAPTPQSGNETTEQPGENPPGREEIQS